MLEYVFIVILFIWAAWYLYRRFRNSFRGGDCGCGCNGCAREADDTVCPANGPKEKQGAK